MPRYIKKGYRRKIDVRQATLLYEAGVVVPRIAEFFGVTRQAVYTSLAKAGVHVITPQDRSRNEHRPLSEAEFAEMFRELDRRLSEEAARWKEEHRTRNTARASTRNAIASGKLTPLPCEDCGLSPRSPEGKRQVEAHHGDYTKPLDVRWLCRKHHLEWHRHNKPKYE